MYIRLHDYAEERAQNRRDFEQGMDEVFRTLFTEHVFLYLMDKHNTPKNDVYDEAETKIYLPPVPVTAKVVISRVHGEEVEQTTQQSAVITIPNLQFERLRDNAGKPLIPHSTYEDLEVLKKAAFKYKAYTFLVDEVKPVTHTSGTYLFYEFQCTTQNKTTTRYVFPPYEPPEEPKCEEKHNELCVVS